jgi:hypothetical protein
MKSLKIAAVIALGFTLGMPPPAPTAGYQSNKPFPQGSNAQVRKLAAVEERPVYKPWRPGPPPIAPRGRVGSGVRGGGGEGALLLPLAPDHVGFTTEEQPSLYWYLAETTSSALEFTLRDDRTIKPVIETRIVSPAQPGVQRVSLKDLGVKLEAGVQYRWFVTLIQGAETSSRDMVAGGIIERVELLEALPHLEAIKTEDKVSRYALAGFWYDAIKEASNQIEQSPNDQRLRCKRAFLLKQIALSEIAKRDCKE